MFKRFILYVVIFLVGCSDSPLNSPYPNADQTKKVLYTSFTERPKTLDPVKSYSSNEYTFLHLIYEPTLTYHYLKRPYTLEKQLLTTMPKIVYLDSAYKVIDKQSKDIAYTRYEFELMPNIKYQPHPAFAKKNDGAFYYYPIDEAFFDDNDIENLSDFAHTGTRVLTAHDYVYQIKRIADPFNSSPIASLMADHIVGFKAFSKKVKNERKLNSKVDLRTYNLDGVKATDNQHFSITIVGKYHQFIYWLAMPFFSPMPWEAVQFYDQPGMKDRNITLSWYPVGTGPYMLVENNPNRRMLLRKNPNYHPSFFPKKGSALDIKNGYLKFAGHRLPMIDEIIFSLEKESIPRWNKFLQGYYDYSGISNDSFDQAISVTKSGKPMLTKVMEEKGITLQSSIQPSIFYMGFNMLDDIVGGNNKSARKLRQAISIAVNYEEYISIFLNGRGQIAQGPIPPGISGYRPGKAGVNPFVYNWTDKGGKRKSISYAKKLMVEAGYPNGRSIKTGKPIILNYDTPAGIGPEEKAYFSWLRKQFSKIGISLNIRATQYNRFQQKMRTGKAQIFSWGWNADYPDPENFLFLFLSTNGKVKFHGENAANYSNSEYDKLFKQMSILADGDERSRVIYKMVNILQKDAPWIWGFYPKQFSLKQAWLSSTKPMTIGSGNVKYLHVNPQQRANSQKQWNQPILWPLGLLLLIFLATVLPIVIAYQKRIHKPRVKIDL